MYILKSQKGNIVGIYTRYFIYYNTPFLERIDSRRTATQRIILYIIGENKMKFVKVLTIRYFPKLDLYMYKFNRHYFILFREGGNILEKEFVVRRMAAPICYGQISNKATKNTVI